MMMVMMLYSSNARFAKEKEKGDNFELELSPRLVISPNKPLSLRFLYYLYL
jgi:hypothetical protein